MVHAEIQEFSANVIPGAAIGMAPAGQEEMVVRQLHKAGSFDASGLYDDLVSPNKIPKAYAAEDNQEEQKEWI